MKTLSTAFATVAALIAVDVLAQVKPGDFEVDPLPPQTILTRRLRASARPGGVESVRPCETNICATDQPSRCLEITFPETAWRTCVSNQGRRGLVLGPTELKRTHSSPWMRVLREGGVAEIFVPYHGLNLRLYDHETTNRHSIREVTPADAGAMGTVLTLSGQNVPQIAAEINDRGIAWLCKEGRNISRRGVELVLWGVQDAANYDFIHEYRLRDDGSIGFRLGATGYNNPYSPPRSTTEAHMHDVVWRLDVDMNGAANDHPIVLRHIETAASPLMATDLHEPFNGGREGTSRWEPETFYSIAIEDMETRNVHGNRIGYVLRTAPTGIARHYGEAAGLRRKEKFTQIDFAVTTYKQSERDALFDSATVRYLQPDEYLLGDGSFIGMGVSDNEPVAGTDVVLWHRSSVHHDPHDEDHAPGDPPNLMTGITPVHWQGVDLEPHNLFDYNPLGGPSRTQCQ